MKLIRLKLSSIEELNNLYKEVNQDDCLVSLPIPLPSDKAEVYLEAINNGFTNDRELISYGIYEEDELIGKIEATVIDNIAELDLVIKEKYENKGYGKKALKEFVEILRDNKIHTIEAYINENNKKMVSILEANKFIKGRDFKADIMKENEGIYKIISVVGIEYSKDLLQVL